MNPQSKPSTRSYTINCRMTQEAAALERLCQVVRIRGFRIATMAVYRSLPEGTAPETETAAEIVAAMPDGMTLVFSDSPGERVGFVDISDPALPAPAGSVAIEGEPTAVATAAGTVFAGVNTSGSFVEPSGHVAVIDAGSREIVARCDIGGQPDSLAVSPDGRFLAVVVENERDEDLNDGVIPQLPPGSLAVFDLEDGRPANCDSARMVDLTGLADVAPSDPEPEFVDINADNIAVVTLQENNHLALVDLASGSVTGHFSAGTVNLKGIDTVEDDIIAGTGSLTDVPREPDAVAWLGTDRFVTADEGDYEGGSRGFTVFNTDGTVEYTSGELMEHLGMAAGHYPEGRAENKGVEPEGAEFAGFDGTPLMFINSERGNFVAVFRDQGAGAAPELVDVLPTSVAPEGLLAIPERNLFVVATEEDSAEDGIRSTLQIFSRTATRQQYPMIVSAGDPATGAPIGWGALSGLAADPDNPGRLYAVNDSFYAASRIYTIDTARSPAVITDALTLMKDGEPAAYDLEGVALRQGGGFWVASEGRPDRDQQNLIIAVAADGTVEQEIALPEAVDSQAKNHGFEGVASWVEDGTEHLIVAVQREWSDDPDNHVKLGIHTPSTGEWGFVRYPIEEPSSPQGGWVGLSEIVHLGDRRFALIERDNQGGPYGTFKALTTISLAGVEPAPAGGDLPVVDKRIVADLLPAMRATKGWISDKPEGLAVLPDGTVIVVTDNDGVDDASGETQFLRLGSAEDVLN